MSINPLTTNIDNIVGTSGDDLIIGSTGVAPITLNAADQINGMGGVNTLKDYGAFVTADIPAGLSNIQILELVNPAIAGVTVDSTGIAGLTKLQIDQANTNTNAAQDYKTGNGVALQLATATGTTTAGTADTWTGSTTDTTATLILNGYNDNGDGLTVNAAALKTLTVTSQGAANTIKLAAGQAGTTKLVVNGDQSLNMTAAALTTTIKTVDASASSGGVQVAFNASGVTFTGGSGNDTAYFTAGNLTNTSTLNGGSGTADFLGSADTAFTSATSDVMKGIQAATNFEGLALTTAGSTVDASLFTKGITTFRAEAGAGTYTFNNTTSATTEAIKAVNTGANDFTIANALGDTSANLKMEATSGSAATIQQLVLTGVNTLAVDSAFSGTGAQATANALVLKTNNDNTVFNVSGAQALTLSGIQATSTGSTVNAGTMTGKLTATGSVKADSITGGSAADSITGDAGRNEVQTLTVTGACSSTTTATVTVAGTAVTVSLTTGDTTAQVATKIANALTADSTVGAMGSFTTNVAGTGVVMNFNGTQQQTNVALSTYAPGTSGTTATVAETTAGIAGGFNTADVLKGNGGNDVFNYNAMAQSSYSATGTTNDTITDFTAGADKFDISNLTYVADTNGYQSTDWVSQSTVQALVNAAAPTTLAAAVTAAAGTGGIVANHIGAFQYDGNTYMFANDGNSAVSTTDFLVKMTGTVNLTTADVTFHA